MKPKEKAKELVRKMANYQSRVFLSNSPDLAKEYTKQHALIAVDDILNINSVEKRGYPLYLVYPKMVFNCPPNLFKLLPRRITANCKVIFINNETN